MSLQSENARGWLGTIIVHLLVALVLFLWKLDLSASEPEYIEVSLVNPGQTSIIARVPPSGKGSSGSMSNPLFATSKPMNLPRRRFAADGEVIHVPPATKIKADEQPTRISGHIAENSAGRKERGVGLGIGQKERPFVPGLGEGAGSVTDGRAMTSAGASVGKNISMSMQWSDGGTRKKLSGALPEYPAGVKVEALIKIEIVVLPDGRVKSLRPIQKGNTKLEEAAMNETRLWVFEPLTKSTPQRDQACLVTFNFRLR